MNQRFLREQRLRNGLLCYMTLLCLTSFAVTPAEASHFRYGHLTWKARPDVSPTTVELSLINAFRRSGYTGTGTDGRPVTGDTFSEGVGGTDLFPGDGTTITGAAGSLQYRVIAYDTVADWVIGVALDPTTGQDKILHNYPTENNAGSPWVAYIASCCRITTLANSPGGNYRVETFIDLTQDDHSPVSSLPPIVSCPQGGVCNFLVPGADPEPGTKLQWRLATGAEDGGITQPTGLTIDPNTGTVSWDTTGQALDSLWATQAVIEKLDTTTGQLLTKVAVDYIIRIVPPGTGPVIEPPPNSPPICNTTVPAFVGSEVTFAVGATDPDTADQVTLNTAGLPAGATTTPVLPVAGNPVAITFSWTPTSADVGTHVINFIATDSGGLQALCPVTIDVRSARAGVTVLVHGFNPPTQLVPVGANNPLDYWDKERIKIPQLLNRLGGGLLLQYLSDTGNYEEIPDPGFSYNRNENGEHVLLFNWLAPSNNKESGQAEAAADALFASLVEAGYVDPVNPGASAHLHFIGHSRGCPVVSETVQRLGIYGITVDYVTYLDNHDFGEPAIPVIDEYFHDPAVQVWNNVLFADNYYQQSHPPLCAYFNPTGRPLGHLLQDSEVNRSLTSLEGFNDCFQDGNVFVPHSRVLDFYWGTIGLGTQPSSWYAGGNGSIFGFERWWQFGGYSRTTPDSLILTSADPKTLLRVIPFDLTGTLSYKFDRGEPDDNGVPSTVFMGNFDLPHLGIHLADDITIDIAGWAYHGGGGNGLLAGKKIKKGKGNRYLRLHSSVGAFYRQHNRLYIPPNTTSLVFDLSVVKKDSDAFLQFYIGTNAVGPSINLAVQNKLFTTKSIPVPQEYRGTVNTFRFEIIDPSVFNIRTAQVYLDNIRFSP